jgi:pimeloyl-ACP methyl ester carboxylesterase
LLIFPRISEQTVEEKMAITFWSFLLLILLILIPVSGYSGQVDEGYVTAEDGIRLFYRKVGNGPKTIIIPLGFIMYDDFKQMAEGRTLIFYDMRNRGRSDSVSDAEKITIHDDVKDLEKIRQHFKVKKFSTIGYSYLGLMVVMYAMDHPENIERIVQIGPVPIKFGTQYPAHLTANDEKPVFDQAEVDKLLKLREEKYHINNPKEYCEKQWLVTRFMFVGNPANVYKLGKGQCDMPNEWPINFERHLQHHFGSVQKLDIPKEKIAKVSIPVLTIHGTKDRNAPYGAGREWASILPNARLITVKGAAHQAWVDAPDLVFPAIDKFFKGDWPEQAVKDF